MKKTSVIVILLILAILWWSPWMTDSYVRTQIANNPDFKEVRPINSDLNQIEVSNFPFFSRSASTPEAEWFVAPWGQVYKTAFKD